MGKVGVNPLHQAVNDLCQLGIAVIPIPPNTKAAEVKWKQYEERRPTVEELRGWFGNGESNIAAICGRVSGGLAVLDIDDSQLAERMANDVGLQAETTLIRTPKGLHIWVKETEATSHSTPLIPGTADLKADGGYVLVPPSSINGRQYTILTNTTIKSVPNAREWAVGLLRAYDLEVPDQRHEPLNIAQVVDEMHEGNRNDSLFRVLSKLRGKGLGKEELETFAYQTGRGQGLDDGEIATILGSVTRYPTGETNGWRLPPESSPRVHEWPAPAAEEAFYGLAGDIVRTLEPHTEADPHALLADILATFGMLAGPHPHFMVGLQRHEMRVCPVIVGPTGHGRKGLSHAEIVGVFNRAVSDFYSRLTTGLSSGEGLIQAVHDPIFRHEAVKEKGRVVDYQDILVDAGVEDKRLLVVEPEFARTLRVLSREGNTLSPVIRLAWDSGNLKTMTKSPATATGAHITIVAHITKEELLHHLDSTEAGSGFANRFIWIAAKRSKLLPDGGKIPVSDLNDIARRLNEALTFAATVEEMQRDAIAHDIWHEVYQSLSQGKPGLFGAVVGRGEANVMRLACIYALMDTSSVVKAEHLTAALGLWEYVEATVLYIFGDATGDRTADTILRALRAQGPMTQTEIYAGLFGSNRSAEQIAQALSLLAEAGLAVSQEVETAGRPVTIWSAK